MDGGSSDNTEILVEKFADKYPVKWHTQKDRTVFEGMWNGAERSSGDVMGTIFADDFYMPWTLAVVEHIFASRPDILWITGIPSWYLEDSCVSVTAPYAPVYSRSLIRRGWQVGGWLGGLQQESIFWRRSLWEKERSEIERILKTYRYAADFHLWRVFARHAKLHTVSSVLACFTISATQISTKFRRQYLEECGVDGDSFGIPLFAKAFNRLSASARYRQVIRPASIARDEI
jgi:hypothetical protein